jgi:hypothetical protein
MGFEKKNLLFPTTRFHSEMPAEEARNFITTSLSNLLLHILQMEKIATKIAAKIARVNGPYD